MGARICVVRFGGGVGADGLVGAGEFLNSSGGVVVVWGGLDERRAGLVGLLK